MSVRAAILGIIAFGVSCVLCTWAICHYEYKKLRKYLKKIEENPYWFDKDEKKSHRGFVKELNEALNTNKDGIRDKLYKTLGTRGI